MVEDANLLAWAALLGFPVLAMAVMHSRRGRWPFTQTVSMLTIGAVMFLPVKLAIDLPALPPFDKNVVATAGVLLACALFHRDRVRFSEVFSGAGRWIAVLSIASFFTALTNTDPIWYGPVMLPGLSLHDGFQFAVDVVAGTGLPFLLGRIAFRKPQDLVILFRVLAMGGLVYVPLILIELRFSPQVHRWVYGYQSFADFLQALRGGGYRPNVFMNHGLSLSLWLSMTLISAALLGRVGERVFKYRPSWVSLVLGAALIACKSLGALVYGVVIVPIVRFLSPRAMALVACTLALVPLTYPILRATETFPVGEILELAAGVEAERAQSLEFRFVNEDALLVHARERLTFGWGSFDRNHVFDRITGEDLSVTDGTWIIYLGTRGVVGWFCGFMLLLAPVFGSVGAVGRVSTKEGTLIAGLALMVAVHTVDLLPNSLSDALPLFYAGALAQVVSSSRALQRKPLKASIPSTRGEPAHLHQRICSTT